VSMKNPLTLAGIEPATFRFVTQHLNHCATAAPSVQTYVLNFLSHTRGWEQSFSLETVDHLYEGQ
jgi:hypothetical protein